MVDFLKLDYNNITLSEELQEDLEFLLKHHSNPETNKVMIIKALKFATVAHKGQKRKNNEEDYIIHPIAVATMLCKMGVDYETICAGLLHDTIEDTKIGKIDKEVISQVFTPVIAKLVDGVTKVSPEGATKEESFKRTINKLVLTIEDDPRIIIIKLVDRWHNMKTIYGIPNPEDRLRIAKQTMEIFVPLARMLSMYDIKDYLEKKAYEVIEHKGYTPKEWQERLKNGDEVPSTYDKLEKERQEKYVDDDAFMAFVKDTNFFINVLKSNPQIDTLFGEPKKHIDFKFRTLPQIAEKIHLLEEKDRKQKEQLKKNLNIDNNKEFEKVKVYSMDDIHDIVKITINVNSIEDCYKAMETFNNYEKGGRKIFGNPFYVKDYIENPAFNGYQSIHARYYIQEFRKRIQIEFRTFEMRSRATEGIASCWNYDRTAAEPEMVKFLNNLPFYVDLKKLCYEYVMEMKKASKKDIPYIEEKLNNGLKNIVFAKRIRIMFDGKNCQEHLGCTLKWLIDKYNQQYENDGSEFMINGSFVGLDKKLEEDDIIIRIPPIVEKEIQRTMIRRDL